MGRISAVVAILGALALSAGAGTSATADDVHPLSATGTGIVTGGAGGPGVVTFDAIGTEPVAAGDWQGVSATGSFVYIGKTSFAGKPANALVTMQPAGITQLCGLVWPKNVPAVVFSSRSPDGGRLVITDSDHHVVVDEAVYVKVYVYFLDNGRTRIEMSTDYSSLGFTMWLDGWMNGNAVLEGTNGLTCT